MTDQEIVELCMPLSMTGSKRLQATVSAMHAVEDLDGDVVECGVWRGGNIIAAMLTAIRPRQFWLFDTFDGMPEPGEHDYRKGRHATENKTYRTKGRQEWCRSELLEVQHNVSRYQRSDQEVRYVVGQVEHTLYNSELPDHIALLRLDTDFYSSTLVELQVLWPRLRSGGVLIIDDYFSWDGCRKACDEFFGPDVEFEPVHGPTVRLIKP